MRVQVASSKQWRVPPQWGQHQAVANWANSINPLGTTIDLNQVAAPGPAVAVVQAPGVRKEKKIYKKKKRHLSSRLGTVLDILFLTALREITALK